MVMLSNLDSLKRRCKVLLLREKVKVLYLTRKEKNHTLSLLRPMGKTNLLPVILRSEKESHAGFAVALKLQGPWHVLFS